MNNTLMVYLSKRLRQRNNKYPTVNLQPGPVICISGEVGCGGLNIAQLLATELDKQGNCKKWRVLSKGIIDQSAMELNMELNQFRSYLKEGDRGLFDEILSAFNDNRFKAEPKITPPLIDLVTSFANDGHCIIVGRAAHIVSGVIQKSLFIKLVAPNEWRVQQIMEKNNVSRSEAIDIIREEENIRHNYIKQIADENNKDVEFDLIINLSKMNITEVIDFIQFVAQTKGLLESHNSKVEVF